MTIFPVVLCFTVIGEVAFVVTTPRLRRSGTCVDDRTVPADVVPARVTGTLTAAVVPFVTVDEDNMPLLPRTTGLVATVGGGTAPEEDVGENVPVAAEKTPLVTGIVEAVGVVVAVVPVVVVVPAIVVAGAVAIGEGTPAVAAPVVAPLVPTVPGVTAVPTTTSPKSAAASAPSPAPLTTAGCGPYGFEIDELIVSCRTAPLNAGAV